MSPTLITPETAIWKLGASAEGRPLDAFAIAPRGASELVPAAPTRAAWPWILFLSGVHGDETEGVHLLEEIRTRWAGDFPSAVCGAVIWPQVNPDGVARLQRWNARGVDLNRNLPTKDWTDKILKPRYPPGKSAGSEPESKALIGLIKAIQPKAILSFHSFSKAMVNLNGPSRDWGETISRRTGYQVTADVGYPTPGCLGTYAGAELGIPTITLEIEKGLNRAKVLDLILPVAEDTLRFWEK